MTAETIKFLMKAGVPNHLKGYRYIAEAVELVAEDRERLFQITKVLYPKVAEKYNSTPSRVERAIRKAIEYAFDVLTPDVIDEMFGNTLSYRKDKATNMQFIAVLADLVIRERESNEIIKGRS